VDALEFIVAHHFGGLVVHAWLAKWLLLWKQGTRACSLSFAAATTWTSSFNFRHDYLSKRMNSNRAKRNRLVLSTWIAII
jgi:uncharacterized membrane protein